MLALIYRYIICFLEMLDYGGVNMLSGDLATTSQFTDPLLYLRRSVTVRKAPFVNPAMDLARMLDDVSEDVMGTLCSSCAHGHATVSIY